MDQNSLWISGHGLIGLGGRSGSFGKKFMASKTTPLRIEPTATFVSPVNMALPSLSVPQQLLDFRIGSTSVAKKRRPFRTTNTLKSWAHSCKKRPAVGRKNRGPKTVDGRKLILPLLLSTSTSPTRCMDILWL